MNDLKTIGSKTPFLGAVVFFGVLFWAAFSPLFEGSILRYVVMTIYGLVGLSFAAYGARLHMNGTKTITVSGNSMVHWLLAAVILVVSLVLMVMAL